MYPSSPRLIKLAKRGKALNRLEFSMLTWRGLGTRAWSTSPGALPDKSGAGADEEAVRYAGVDAAGGAKMVVREDSERVKKRPQS
jgi:hypothetical protein